jgi:hypothetical protein
VFAEISNPAQLLCGISFSPASGETATLGWTWIAAFPTWKGGGDRDKMKTSGAFVSIPRRCGIPAALTQKSGKMPLLLTAFSTQGTIFDP